ncbi:MAG: hypothetical protein ACREVP_07890 [Burkholderiales bacterium]
MNISDAGNTLVVTGRQKAAVEAALQELVARGARVVSPPTQLGSKWIASCEKPSGDTQDAHGFQDVAREVARKGVSISRTGGHLLVTGPNKAVVDATLQELARQGARVIGQAASVGSKWMGTCTDPNAQPACTVEMIGLQIIISGEERDAVEEKLREVLERGAHLVTPPQWVGKQWIAVCDRAGFEGLSVIPPEQIRDR